MSDRAAVLENAHLRYAPDNELGVVFLFAKLASRWQLRVEKIQPGYPDCIAYQKVGGREKRIRIEFEYRSSNFRLHKHAARCCDWIVCWEHDWPSAPSCLNVIELRKHYDLGFKVWIQPARPDQWHHLDHSAQSWGLSKRASQGDLLLMYRCAPEKRISDLYTVAGPMRVGRANWRDGACYAADIRRVCKLKSPIFLDDLRSHRVLKTSYFVRSNMQGNLRATEYWPYLYDMIIRRNPSVRQRLKKYSPDRM
jgi:hypothetical protein